MSDNENNKNNENIKINENNSNQTNELENDSKQNTEELITTEGDEKLQEEDKEETEFVLSLEEQKALQEEVRKLSEDNKTLKDKLLRTHADYQNFRRRTQEDLNKRSEQGKFWLLSDLITSLDQMFIINANWTPEDSENSKTLTKFLQSFQEDLEKIGFKRIESIGKPLDLKLHEVAKSPNNNSNEELVIISEVKSGYIYKDRVIRPAMVELGVLISKDEESEKSSESEQ